MNRTRHTTTKNDLARQVAEVCGMSIKSAESAIDAMVDGITRSVKAGNRVEIRNFGVFLQKHHKSLNRGNLRTGQPFRIPPCMRVGFKTSEKLKVYSE